MSEQPDTRETVFRVGVECGVSTALGWWCMLSPAHSGPCIPRRDTEYGQLASAGPGEETTP